MQTSWMTWIGGYLKLVSFIFWTILQYSGNPNHNIVLKLPPIVANTPQLADILIRLLTFEILYSILMLPSRWSMDQMPYLWLAVTFCLSIRLSCLLVNSNVGITFSTIIALGKPNQRALSSSCIWIVMRTLPILWPRSAHLTPGPPSWNLLCYGMIWTSLKS